MNKIRLDEDIVKDLVTKFLQCKQDGNWHEDKTKTADLHGHGVDIKLCGGKRNSEYFLLNVKASPTPKALKASIDKIAGFML